MMLNEYNSENDYTFQEHKRGREQVTHLMVEHF